MARKQRKDTTGTASADDDAQDVDEGKGATPEPQREPTEPERAIAAAIDRMRARALADESPNGARTLNECADSLAEVLAEFADAWARVEKARARHERATKRMDLAKHVLDRTALLLDVR